MRVLFFMAHPGHARNFESVLRTLCERGHHVTVALDRGHKDTQPGVGQLLTNLVDDLDGLEVLRAPRGQSDWPRVGVALRASLDYLRFLDPAWQQSPKPRERAAKHVPRATQRIASTGPLATRGGRTVLRSGLTLAERGVPASDAVENFIIDRAPDVVVVTPLIDLGSPQTEYIRSAHDHGIPTALLAASWDDLTLRGLIHELPTRVLLWNALQEDEAHRLHGVPRQAIVVTGAPAYDHWFDWTPTWSEREFKERVGLDPDRPYILYLGSSDFIAPEEAGFVERWTDAVRGSLEGIDLPRASSASDQPAAPAAVGAPGTSSARRRHLPARRHGPDDQARAPGVLRLDLPMPRRSLASTPWAARGGDRRAGGAHRARRVRLCCEHPGAGRSISATCWPRTAASSATPPTASRSTWPG